MRKHFEDEIKTLVKRVESLTVKVFEQKITSPITPPATPSEPGSRPYAEMVSHSEKIGSPVEKLSETISNQERIIEINEREKREKNIIIMGLEDSEDSIEDIVMTLIENKLELEGNQGDLQFQKDWQARPDTERPTPNTCCTKG